MRFYEIYPGLYQRGATYRLPTEQVLAELKARNITTVVCLIKKYDRGVMFGVEEWKGKYWYRPISDGKTIDPLLPQLALRCAERIREGDAVLSHCAAGRNRSALLSALIVRELTGMSGAEAMSLVRERRPNSLANVHFAAYLDALPAKEK